MAATATLGPAPEPVAVLRAHRCAVSALAFHPPTGHLLSGDADGELKIWDIVRRKPLSAARVHTPNSGVIGIGTGTHLQDRILSQGRDGTVKCWQLTNGGLSRQPVLSVKTDSYHFCKLSVATITSEQPRREHTSLHSHCNGVEAPLDCTEGGRVLIAIAGNDPSTVDIWDVDGGKRVEQLQSTTKSSGMCMAIKAFRLEGTNALTVVSGHEDGSMAVWDLRSTKAPQIKSKSHSEPVISIDMDSSGRGGVSGAADDKLVFFSLNHEENLHHLKKEFVLGKPGIADIAIRQDDKICATAGWDSRIRIYDYHRKKALAVLKYHAKSATSVVFSRDMKLLASSSNDATIALWSIYPPQ